MYKLVISDDEGHATVVPLLRDEITIGRQEGNTIRLTERNVSRSHARLLKRNGSYVVEDLGSYNGVTVNGERIEEHQLRPGDRIEIGGDTITFCHVGGQVDSGPGGDRGEAKTIMIERPALGEAFQGDLAEIPPFAMLQILEMGRKTGVVHIDSDAETGRLWLDNGTPIHAETKNQTGFDAALAIINAETGRFSFEPLLETPDATIDASVTELLLEASRLHDESLI